MRRFILTVIVGLVAFGVIAWSTNLFSGPSKANSGQADKPGARDGTRPADYGPRMHEPMPAEKDPVIRTEADPTILADCHLVVIDKLEVGARTDGKLLFVGYLVAKEDKDKPGVLPATIYRNGEKETIYYRRLQEGDFVREDQMVAMVDPTLALNQVALKSAKLEASKADYEGAVALQKVYSGEVVRLENLKAKNKTFVSDQEYQVAVAQRDKYTEEAVSKKEAIQVAKNELIESQTMLELHTLRNTIHPRDDLKTKYGNSIIKAVLKNPGDPVKNLETVMQVQNVGKLRAEALVDVQRLSGIEEGLDVDVHATQRREPVKTLRGHRGEVTCIAVSSDEKDPLIVSGSEDTTARVWQRSRQGEKMIWHHPAAVRSIACSPRGAKGNYCLTGCADGSVRLWDLDKDSDKPVWEKTEQHGDAVTALAFSPDGKYYASGGEDNVINLWKTEDGSKVYAFDSDKGHQGAVTSLNFTPDFQLVSAGRDNTLRVWTLHQKGAELNPNMPIANRGGSVPNLGVSKDGRFMLFDQGKTLQVMSLARGRTVGVIQDPSESTPFETLAVFSPDAALVLTASASEGRLRLWRTPTEKPYSYEVRQFIPKESSPATCAAFGTDANLATAGAKDAERTFAVTGTKDGQIYLWAIPTKDLADQKLKGKVSLKELFIEPSTRQARLWVEIDNKDGLLTPGETTTVVVPRKAK